jgi:hypothetical protein
MTNGDYRKKVMATFGWHKMIKFVKLNGCTRKKSCCYISSIFYQYFYSGL